MTREIGLVSCVKTKQETAAAPKDLYTSTYFRRMQKYAEEHHDDWLILSAKHGVLETNGPAIEPYEKTLTNASKAEKRSWAEQVVESLESRGLLDEGTVLVIHAGKDYYEELVPLLDETPVEVEIPTEGLRFGETLSWYGDRV